jgi:UDP-glucuronate 4-epimerase
LVKNGWEQSGKMKVLVTGAAGFIGSHLCENLLSKGYEVVGIDNFDPFYKREIKEKNLSHFKENSYFTFYEMDICSTKFAEFLSAEKFPIVVHLAAMAGVRPSIQNPQKYLKVNIEGLLNILEVLKTYPVKNFVFASSSSVYGGNKVVPYSETHNVDHPVSPYAATKKMGEVLIYNYHHLYKIPSTLLRFFTVYGPRQRPEMAIHKFVRAIFKEEEIPLFGDGNSSRDYTYIDDIIAGVTSAIENPHPYEIFNLGNSYPVKLNQLVDLLEKIIGKKARRKYLPMQPGDVWQTWSDIQKSKDMLSYQPTTPIEKGLEKFIQWYKENMLGKD